MQIEYDRIQELNKSTFISLILIIIEEVTHYQDNWKRTLEIFDNNIAGLGFKILYDVINIDEFVKVKVSETTVVPEISFNDIIQRTFSEILSKIEELVKSNQTKPLIQNGWVQLFLNIIVGMIIALYFASNDEKFIKLKFEEQEILIQEAIKKINDKIDTVSDKTEWRSYIISLKGQSKLGLISVLKAQN